MVLLSVDFSNLHTILESLYNEMMPLCGDMLDVAKGLAGLGALFYVAVRVWQEKRFLHKAAAVFFSWTYLLPYIVTVRRKGQYVSRLIVGDVYAVAGIDEQVTVFFHQQIGFRLQLPCLYAAGEDRHLVGVPFLIYKDIGLSFHTAP